MLIYSLLCSSSRVVLWLAKESVVECTISVKVGYNLVQCIRMNTRIRITNIGTQAKKMMPIRDDLYHNDNDDNDDNDDNYKIMMKSKMMMMRLSSISSSYQDEFVTLPIHPVRDNIFSHDGDADDDDYILMVMIKIYETK